MQNENSVCFVGKIEQINPIQGADKLEQAIISGWECVIQKGKFVVGEKVVIAVTDAVIPIQLADSLNITNYLKHRKKTDQYTVKTVKLRGVYSSATIIRRGNPINDMVGDDCMSDYNITKYEEPETEQVIYDKNGKVRKMRFQKNPNFHVYHKFPNVKNVVGMFFPEDDVVVTQKIHGTNARYAILRKSKLSIWDRIKKFLRLADEWIDYEFVYGSHQVQKGSDTQGYYSTDVWKDVAEEKYIRFSLWKYAKSLGKDKIGEGIIIYGEIYGPGIQKYYEYGVSGKHIALFDIKLNGEYLEFPLFKDIATHELSLPICKVLYQGKYDENKIKATYIGKTIPGTSVPEEGVVVKAVDGSRLKVAKFINPAYLEFQSKKEDSTDFH